MKNHNTEITSKCIKLILIIKFKNTIINDSINCKLYIIFIRVYIYYGTNIKHKNNKIISYIL